MSNALYNLAAMTVASSGTGTITLGSAATINGVTYLSFTGAGVPSGGFIYYSINDPTGQSEVGSGTYSSSTLTLTRTPITTTNGNAAINMSRNSIVRVEPVASQFREVLSSDRTYFWRSDAADTNTGLTNSSAGAFATLSAAYSAAAALDFNSHNVTLFNGNGATYTVGVNMTSPWIGGGTLTIDLNGGTINSTQVSIQNSAAQSGTITVQGGLVRCSVGSNLVNGAPCHMFIGSSLTFGPTGSGGYHMLATTAGAIIDSIATNYTINGVSTTAGGTAGHMEAADFGFIESGVNTVTISTNGGASAFNFTNAFAFATKLGLINTGLSSFPGSSMVTGARYFVNENSDIDTSGGSSLFFPGNATGASSTGGQYV